MPENAVGCQLSAEDKIMLLSAEINMLRRYEHWLLEELEIVKVRCTEAKKSLREVE